MNSSALIAALRTACRSCLIFGPGLTAGMLLRVGYLLLALFTALGSLVHRTGDPRLILAHGELVERFAQQIHLSQLTFALDAEVSGAHALSLETYAALRRAAPPNSPATSPMATAPDGVFEGDFEGCFDDEIFAGEPHFIAGRPCYKNAGELLAAWTGISYFEAQQRIDDAHLLIGRRTAEGTICAPRLPELAQLYSQGRTNRRAVVSVARQLNSLEPPDTTFEGTECEIVARGTDGNTLDACAAKHLSGLSPLEARKQINAEIKIYKDLNGKKLPPKLGLFIGSVVNGVHCFSLRTNASDAQLIRSIAARAGNPRTQAGRADRQSDQDRTGKNQDGANGSDANHDVPDPAADDLGTPDWLRSEEPMPPWAGSDPEADTADTADTDSTGSTETQESATTGPDVHVRRLNGLMSLLAAPYVGGKRKVVVPKFVVYLWLADLQNLADAHGMTANGVDIPPGELRQLLAKADIIPLVLGGNSQPLDMGRKMRYHKGPIREAIMARDRGCIVPDCTAPPDQVETDHYEIPWSEGGETSVWSGAGMCTGDHHKRHAGQIKVINVEGLPHVILPEHEDPEQKPRRNTYWGARQAGESPPRRQADPADQLDHPDHHA